MNVIAPLEGLDLSSRAASTQGGYEFLQHTGEVYHPGLDFNAGIGPNADCGRLLVCPRIAVVRYSGWHMTASGRGFGNHAWLETDTGHFLHYCHALAALPPEGTWLHPKQGFGVCGKTAGWDFCHVHMEVRDTIPSDWNQWVTGWTYQRVAREYRDPFAWLLEYAVEGQLDVDQIAALKAQIEHLNNVNTILAAERDHKDQLLQAANSRIGALEVDVIPPLRTQVETLLAQLQQPPPAADEPVESVEVRLPGRVVVCRP